MLTMQIEVLASSSKANAYVVYGKQETLLLDCGLSFAEIKKKLNFRLPDLCFCSHEHFDHSKSLYLMSSLGVRCFASRGTYTALSVLKNHNMVEVRNRQEVYTKEFALLFFSTLHDAADPLGVLVMQKSTGKKILFATDTYYIHYHFPGVGTMLIECNYTKDILDNNDINAKLRDRIVQSHFELVNLKHYLSNCDQSKLQNVVLLHLSDGNSDEKRFVKEISEVTKAKVQIAKPGLKILV